MSQILFFMLKVPPAIVPSAQKQNKRQDPSSPRDVEETEGEAEMGGKVEEKEAGGDSVEEGKRHNKGCRQDLKDDIQSRLKLCPFRR